MGGYELNLFAGAAKDTKNADVNCVPQVLLSQVFGHGPLFPDRSDVEFLACASGELSLRRKSRDTAQHGLVRRFELDKDELSMHRNPLEVAPIRQDYVGMEFQSALTEAAKYADDVLAVKQMADRHALAISRLGGVSILQSKGIKDWCLTSQSFPHSREDFVLKHIEIEVHQRGILVCLLQAARIKRNREAFDG